MMTAAFFQTVTPNTLKQWLHDKEEIALLDIREHGQYGEEHLFYVVSTPYSKLEADVQRMVRRKEVRMVLVGDDENHLTRQAAHRLVQQGYTNIHLLEGGIAAWKKAGYEVFAGVNLPSKAFGELAEHAFNTPRITAQELNKKIAARENLIVLDGRPFTEYRKMSIPTATCCPNGELPLRIDDLVPSKETTIVINCAGRTRSIIGAQTLINLGITNKILALENGTQGWFLADLELDHGAQRKYPEQTNAAHLLTQQSRARALAEKYHVPFVSGEQVERWLTDPSRTTFLCDVRSPEEFAKGSVLNAQNTPGGQLVQATDQFIGVRGARIVVLDDECVRAPAMASWLAMLGWDVAVLTDGFTHQWSSALSLSTNKLQLGMVEWPCISTQELKERLQSPVVLIDVRSSTQYRLAHLKGATWSIRPRLDQLPSMKGANIVLLAEDLVVANLAALDLKEAGATQININIDTPSDWRAAGLSLEQTPEIPSNNACIDYLFFVHDRHEGNRDAANRYLEWEINLLNQIDEQERQSYRLPH